MALNEIKENVLSLLKENKGNEIIFDWIDDNVCGNGDPLFIRALVTAVHEYAITGSGVNCKLDRRQLKTRTALLKRYIQHNEKYELQALYSIQVLMNQLGQPCGLLSQIFDVLYDNNVISGKTFRIWEFSTDPNESEGRDVAVLSVRSFFVRLSTKEQLKLLTKKKSRSEDKKNISDKASKIVKRYHYKEDQWSPLNPEGKRQYDRDFLLQLQDEPFSLCKPTNLPNLDVIKDKAHIQRLTEVNRVIPQITPQIRYNDPFMPQYAKSGPHRLLDVVDSIRLGPGSRGPSSWGRGRSGDNKTTAEEVKTAANNRYSALESLSNYDGRRGSQRSAASSLESSRGRINQLSTSAHKTSSTSKERGDLLESVQVFNKPAEAKAQDTKMNDANVDEKAADPNNLSLRGPEYNDEEMERKTKPIIDEFLHNNDFMEAIKCVTELASPNTVHMFINTAINKVLEQSSQARYSLGQLLFSLLKKKIISFEQYKKGVGSVLEIIDDYALDIPLIWDYMGEILEPMIKDAEFPLTFLKEVLQPCIPSEKAGLLVSAILHCSAKRKGTTKLGEFLKESGLQWMDFLEPGADVNEFIRNQKLEFTVSPMKVKPNVQMTIEEIKKKLISLLKENEDNDSVSDWIDANVSENREPAFIRALVTAVHEHVITGSGANCELSNQQLKNRTALFTRYINHNEKLELQALYAIQAFMNQLGQPRGLLRQIFDILYDDDVITEETFKVWESSTDPNESEGRGVAVHSVKSFFTWLRESESGEEPEE